MSVFDDELKNMMEGEFSEDFTLETPFTTISLSGFFDQTYEQVDPDTGAVIMSNSPRVSVYAVDLLSQVDRVEEGWILNARGKRYRIKNPPHNDGAGILIMELKNA